MYHGCYAECPMQILLNHSVQDKTFPINYRNVCSKVWHMTLRILCYQNRYQRQKALALHLHTIFQGKKKSKRTKNVCDKNQSSCLLTNLQELCTSCAKILIGVLWKTRRCNQGIMATWLNHLDGMTLSIIREIVKTSLQMINVLN